jgi:RNA polymerase sigma factor (sigma-70 family)
MGAHDFSDSIDSSRESRPPLRAGDSSSPLIAFLFGEGGKEYRELIVYSGRLLYHRLRQEYDPEDVVQDVFLSIHRESSLPPEGEEIRLWLRRKIKNRIHDLARTERRRKRRVRFDPADEVEGASLSATVDVPSGVSAPEESVLAQEEFERIRRGLGLLPKVEAQLILLVKLQGRPLRAVARFLHESPAVASRVLYRGTRALRRFLLLCGL